jgi:hypothetical protein
MLLHLQNYLQTNTTVSIYQQVLQCLPICWHCNFSKCTYTESNYYIVIIIIFNSHIHKYIFTNIYISNYSLSHNRNTTSNVSHVCMMFKQTIQLCVIEHIFHVTYDTLVKIQNIYKQHHCQLNNFALNEIFQPK